MIVSRFESVEPRYPLMVDMVDCEWILDDRLLRVTLVSTWVSHEKYTGWPQTFSQIFTWHYWTCLAYSADSDMHLVGYTDSDWAGSVPDRKSTSGCCFSLGFVVIS